MKDNTVQTYFLITIQTFHPDRKQTDYLNFRTKF